MTTRFTPLAIIILILLSGCTFGSMTNPPTGPGVAPEVRIRFEFVDPTVSEVDCMIGDPDTPSASPIFASSFVNEPAPGHGVGSVALRADEVSFGTGPASIGDACTFTAAFAQKLPERPRRLWLISDGGDHVMDCVKTLAETSPQGSHIVVTFVRGQAGCDDTLIAEPTDVSGVGFAFGQTTLGVVFAPESPSCDQGPVLIVSDHSGQLGDRRPVKLVRTPTNNCQFEATFANILAPVTVTATNGDDTLTCPVPFLPADHAEIGTAVLLMNPTGAAPCQVTLQ